VLLTRVTNVTKNWANVNMFSVIVLFRDIVVLLTEAAADLLCEYNKLDAVAGSSINDPVALYLTAQP
jgi:HJR/Mrr/RecB family endonuclease